MRIRSPRIRSSRIALASAAAAGLLTASLVAHAEAEPEVAARAWDQAAVTALASKLAKSCSDLYDTYYKTPGSSGQPGSGSAKDSYRLKHELRAIESSTRQLAGALAAGEGLDETTPYVEDIGVQARDVRELLQRMFVQSPLQQRIDTARDLWRELLPYYGIEPPPLPKP